MKVLWTDERDLALMKIIREIEADPLSELVPSVIAERLADHAVMAGDADRLTTGKVRDRLSLLRKRGVEVPMLSVDRYVPDVEALNAALAGSEE